MSGIGDFLFGEDPEPGRIVDPRTPEENVTRDEAIKMVRGFIAGGGLNPFPGQTTAQLTGLENQLLGQLGEFTQRPGGFAELAQARGALSDILTGGGQVPTAGADFNINPLIAEFSRRPDESGRVFNQVADLLTGRTQDADDPRIQAAITAATRPIIEQFQDRADINRNLFTRAGQFVQPGSSSPFELAQSRLDVGLANALGDTGANIVFQNLQSERQRQANLLSDLQQQFQSDEQRRLAQQQQGLQARGQQLQAVAQTVPFERGQLDALAGALDTAALPRLIEQFGLTQGRDIFEQEQQSLLNLLQLAFGATSPQQIAVPGSPGSTGFLGQVAGGVGTALGGPLGGALADAIF